MATMNGLTLVIGNKNYSSWSMRAWLLMSQYRIEFEEFQIPFASPKRLWPTDSKARTRCSRRPPRPFRRTA